uniref:Aminopeptidase n=1 Tax=Pygocentrus nattereri TaxID=42514 RepID=A0A3B4CE00_PYGNA
MGKGFYISKNQAIVAALLAAVAVVTIIALSIVYSKEKAKRALPLNDEKTSPVTPTSPPSNEPWDKYRLPDTLKPQSYNITLWPRLTEDAQGMYIFTGSSEVVFMCEKETDLIIIHCNKLNLTFFDGHHAKLIGMHRTAAPAIKKTWFQVETQYLVVQLKGTLKPGKAYSLSTEFKGELADDLEGFYRSEYKEDGIKKVVAITQMQATYARKAFPCFDEPAMKAIFHITLIHEPGTIALSNKSLQIDRINVIRTRFEPTKKMSTYLVAFIVSDFTYITKQEDNKDLMVRIWARQKAIKGGQGDYALSITQPIMEFFEKYYNTDYPLSKSDQIALPDFSAGAMENWGLVTYRETALLYDPKTSANGNKQRIATVVSHELAHMWFGNLVTLKWWNDLWLNEGFASYVEYLGADYAEPTWNIKDQIILYDMYRAFAVDSLVSSHPLSCKEEEVNKPAEISQMFNTISYSKGAAVLRMLSEFLTEPVFAKGLTTYLNQFAFGNSVYSDLWDHLQKAVDRTPQLKLPHRVHDIMNRWILQMGFPVVTIDTGTGNVSQKHFLLEPNSVVEKPSEFKYDIIPVINRAQILDDAFNLARASIINITLALRTTKYLSLEKEYIPWEAALRSLNSLFLVFDRSDVYGAMQVGLPQKPVNIYGLFQPFFQLTLSGVVSLNVCVVYFLLSLRFTQIIALSLACKTGLPGCRDIIKAWFRQWMQDPDNNKIHPNLRSTVYCYAIAAGGVEEWDFGWRMFKKATVAAEAVKLRSALACTREPWLLNRYLEYTLDPEKIRKQDATSTIGSISSNIVGQPLAWNFVRARWEYLFKVYGTGSFSFSRLINDITARFCTSFELSEVRVNFV